MIPAGGGGVGTITVNTSEACRWPDAVAPAGGMDESTGVQLKDDGEVSQGMGGGPMGGQRP
ncbi:hypothetical protein AZH45_01250 [Corynebacterium striatum]|nr:hypothetical protein AZH45_01250 [Corynebacterium striatum]